MRSLICIYCGKMTSRNNRIGSGIVSGTIRIHGGRAHISCFENREKNTYYTRKEIKYENRSIGITKVIHDKMRKQFLSTK